jgi:hypothetical protein
MTEVDETLLWTDSNEVPDVPEEFKLVVPKSQPEEIVVPALPDGPVLPLDP